MPHYVQSRFIVDSKTHRRVEALAVCGHRKQHAFDYSDVQSLIDCESCRDWIRKSEKDKHKLKLVENAWLGKNAKKSFWNEKDKRWDC